MEILVDSSSSLQSHSISGDEQADIGLPTWLTTQLWQPCPSSLKTLTIPFKRKLGGMQTIMEIIQDQLKIK